jgi:hypothetical protein
MLALVLHLILQSSFHKGVREQKNKNWMGFLFIVVELNVNKGCCWEVP